MKISKQKISDFKQYALFSCIFILIAILATGKYASAVTEGIKLWAACVLPSLFPYLVLTALLGRFSVTHRLAGKLSPLTGKVFNVGGECGYAFFISLISGYPVGAKTVCDLKEAGLVGEAESVRASVLCSTSSPVFTIGSVGNLMFRSPLFGLCLFAVHLLSAFFIGIIFSFYKRDEKPLHKKTGYTPGAKEYGVLYECVYSSVISVLVVGGLITVFFLLTEIMQSAGLLHLPSVLLSRLFKSARLGEGLAVGIMECTKGLRIISSDGIGFFSLPACAFLCGLGGLSVICQSLAFLKKAKIKTAPFIVAKILQAVLSFIIGFIFSRVLLFP